MIIYVKKGENRFSLRVVCWLVFILFNYLLVMYAGNNGNLHYASGLGSKFDGISSRHDNY